MDMAVFTDSDMVLVSIMMLITGGALFGGFEIIWNYYKPSNWRNIADIESSNSRFDWITSEPYSINKQQINKEYILVLHKEMDTSKEYLQELRMTEEEWLELVELIKRIA